MLGNSRNAGVQDLVTRKSVNDNALSEFGVTALNNGVFVFQKKA
jgi:hypothetical protein